MNRYHFFTVQRKAFQDSNSLVIGALRALFGVDALHDCESGAHHVDGELAQERAAGDQRGQRVAVPRVVLGDDSLVGLPRRGFHDLLVLDGELADAFLLTMKSSWSPICHQPGE